MGDRGEKKKFGVGREREGSLGDLELSGRAGVLMNRGKSWGNIC